MTTSTEMTAIEPTNRKRFGRASIVRNARRVGVIAVAAALATPLALPAFAASSDTGSQESLSALVAQDAQSVSGVVTAGESGLDSARLEVQATTADELAAIRAELEAAAAAEQQRQQAAAAEQQRQQAAAAAAAPAAQSRTNSGAASSSSAAAAPAAASAGASGSVIANAALAQVGVSQDCVQLVRRSIAAAGLPYTGKNGLFNLGPTIPMSQASPGDVIYYANGGQGISHVAIYIGGGRAVHGGWSGYNTVVAGVNIGGSAPVFIDVT
ncbi:NlpC/P60 family protein [Agrococcus jenensis]|uniref:Cell wall-associated NlpC family hydrolase n=1 Tax=Agrococcus jenensis TaxID=46353 RepID=A0A3N2AT60_9MICO|nr:NlpC/P60 family protein [Agrococcus jenensis]ROR66214.1 cell wall-associated NlpC family hydrolase [Agrococcus jenensis]